MEEYDPVTSQINASHQLFLNCEVTDFVWPWVDSTPVVMVHGFSRNAAIWMRWLPKLSETYRVYRMELPGMGSSPPPPRDFAWSREALEQAFVDTLDRFGLSKVHWIGESAGGKLGVLFATTFPDCVASLVLVDTSLRRSASVKLLHNFGESHSAASWGVQEYGMEEYCRRTINARLDTTKASPELVEWYIAQVAKTSADLGGGFKDFVDTLDIEEAIGKIKVPMLLLSGDKSKSVSADQVETMRRVSGIQTRIFEGYGHGLPVLLPDECVKASLEFWNRRCT
jgi:3-oxoadipate enol-lactonase